MRGLLVCAALLLGTGVGAQEPARGPQPGSEAMRARLQRLAPEERAHLARNLEQFERMAPRERARLLERARVLREHERALGGPGHELAPQRGDAALKEAERRLRALLRERGREVRERLPKAVRERLEKAPPELRRRYLERLAEQQERLGQRVLARAREQGGLGPEELRRLERLPPREQVRGLRETLGRRGDRAPDHRTGSRPSGEPVRSR
ncbi:MAG TPA: hypothetical protein VF530_04595 [Planctomycetota bacterium]